MSSHHFVVDKQEPALLVANGEHVKDHIVSNLLEWNPFVVALDGGVHFLLERGTKIDLLIGDLDSIDLSKIKNNPLISNVKQVDNQHNTDLEKGIDYLIENQYKSAHIINSTGKRLDHTLNNVQTLIKYKEKITLCMHDNHSKAFILPKKFKKHISKGIKISLIPLTSCEGISTKGLKYNLEKERLSPGIRSGCSNECFKTGLVEIQYQNGELLWIESMD